VAERDVVAEDEARLAALEADGHRRRLEDAQRAVPPHEVDLVQRNLLAGL